MGSRTLPHYCEHGVPVDGGDFVDSVECKDCKPTRQEKWNNSAIQKVINDAVQSEISDKLPSFPEKTTVPEGYVLVPVEPTEAMLKALLKGARIRSYNRKGMNVDEWSYVQEGWDAMLATLKEQGDE